MKKIAVVALLSACIATPALADNTGKFYGALDLGSVSLNNAHSNVVTSTSFPNPGAFRFAGGYNITPMFAVEASYAMIGDSIINTTGVGGQTAQETAKSSVFGVAGVANVAINDSFGVFGKLGLVNTKADYTLTSNFGAAGTASGSSTNLTFGVGGQYSINKQFAIRAQYEDFGKTKVGAGVNAPDVGATMISIGGVYNF